MTRDWKQAAQGFNDMIPPGKNRSVRLCATFVRTVNVPGRYGDGGLGLSLLVTPRKSGDLSKTWAQAVSPQWQIDPDEPTADGRLVAVRDLRRGGEIVVRFHVERDGLRTLRAIDEHCPERTFDAGNETDICGVVVLVGNTVRGASPSLPLPRPEAAEGVFRAMSPGGGMR